MKIKVRIFSVVLAAIMLSVNFTVFAITKTAWVPDASLNLPNPTYEFKSVTNGTSTMEYMVQMPRVRNFTGATPSSTTKYPVLIALHGSGGESYYLQYKTQVMPDGAWMDHLSKSYEFPFITIVPILPNEPGRHAWNSYEDLVIKALDDTIANYSCDTDRVYLTGFSLGGYGTYDIAMDYPNRFAACVPVAGNHDYKEAPRLANIPFMIFHGIGDFIVSFEEDKKMAEEMQYQSPNPIVFFYILPYGHQLSDEVYCESTFNWMLRQKLVHDIKAPSKPNVYKISTTTKYVKGTLENELGTRIVVKSGPKIIGQYYVDIHGEFSVKIASLQKAGTKLQIYAIDAFKNKSVSVYKTVVKK